MVAALFTDLNVNPVLENDAEPEVVPRTAKVYVPPSLIFVSVNAPAFAVV